MNTNRALHMRLQRDVFSKGQGIGPCKQADKHFFNFIPSFHFSFLLLSDIFKENFLAMLLTLHCPLIHSCCSCIFFPDYFHFLLLFTHRTGMGRISFPSGNCVPILTIHFEVASQIFFSRSQP